MSENIKRPKFVHKQFQKSLNYQTLIFRTNLQKKIYQNNQINFTITFKIVSFCSNFTIKQAYFHQHLKKAKTNFVFSKLFEKSRFLPTASKILRQPNHIISGNQFEKGHLATLDFLPTSRSRASRMGRSRRRWGSEFFLEKINLKPVS